MRPYRAFAYRPEIDGLRGIAILAVLLNHMDHRLLPGGYVGVDVFFVISGFLITTIIRRDLNAGRFSLWNFYARRAKRLIPTATLMVITALIAGYLFFLPNELHLLSKSVVAYGAMLSNAFFYRSPVTYWDAHTRPWPLLHTWSLALEEQFYFAYPWLLWGLARFSLRRQRQVILALLAASFATNIYQVDACPTAAFYLLPGRAWELLVGAACALYGARARIGEGETALGALAVGLICGPMFLFSAETTFPGWAAALPVTGAAILVQMTGGARNIWAKLLGWHPLVALGRISYSLYLFHWPVLVFAKYLWSDSPDTPSSAPAYLAALASFPMAWLSYHLVETPWRRRSMSPAFAIALACGCNLALLTIGYRIHAREGLPERLPPLVAQYAQGATDGGHRSAETNLSLDQIKAGQHIILGPQGPLEFVLWGDSHAGALVSLFDLMAREYGVTGTAYTRNGTPPLLGFDLTTRHCDPEFAEAVLQRIGKERVTCVVLAGRWLGYLRAFTKGTSSDEAPADGVSLLHDSLVRTIARLRKSGVQQIWLVREVPTQPCDVPKTLALDAWWGKWIPLPTPRAVTAAEYADEMLDIDTLFRSLIANDVGVIDLAAEIFANKGGLLTADGRPMYHDDDHVSASGAMVLRRAIRPVFEQLTGSQAPEPALD